MLEKNFCLIPQPRKLECSPGGEGVTLLYYGEIILDGACAPEDLAAARVLKEEIAASLGFAWEIGKGEQRPGCIYLRNLQGMYSGSVGEGVADVGAAASGSGAAACAGTDGMPELPGIPEAYFLTAGAEGITVCGSSSVGLWHGVQTLRQLIRVQGAQIPALRIEDWPDVANRGFYHDVTRGRIPTLAELKAMVDKLAFYKLNQLQLYVEHTFLFHGFSEVWRDDTPLTAEDILELDQYCTERHVELIPSLASFGHLYKVLRTKSYAELCELPGSDSEPFSLVGRNAHHTLDVTNERSFLLVKQMLEEFMPLFTSRYFNLCADETFDLGTGRSREEAERAGKKRLYMDFLKRLCGVVIGHGRIPMFWGDIICQFPEAVAELPEGTVCLNWGYSPEQTDEDTRKLAEAGAVQYVCPGVQGWNNLVNSTRDAYENIRRMCTYARQYGAIGVLNTDWGDYGHVNHPEFSTAGMIYGAAFSWNPQIPDREEIDRAISRLEYGDCGGRFMEVVSGLHGCSIFSWFYAVVYKEKCQGRLPFENEWLSLARVKWDTMEEAGERLARLEGELYGMAGDMPERSRKRVYAYLLAAEGIGIFNQIGSAVQRRERQKEMGISTLELRPDFGLAEELECWYRRYRQLWHTVSRESELYRIREVVEWYGDFLRER